MQTSQVDQLAEAYLGFASMKWLGLEIRRLNAESSALAMTEATVTLLFLL